LVEIGLVPCYHINYSMPGSRIPDCAWRILKLSGISLPGMIGFIIRIFGNSVALFVANYFVSGFVVNGGWKEYLLAGALLGLLNFTVKPVLKLISMPIIILTLGLFTLVINGLLLWTVDYIFDFIYIRDTMTLLYAVVVITIVNLFISVTAKAI